MAKVKLPGMTSEELAAAKAKAGVGQTRAPTRHEITPGLDDSKDNNVGIVRRETAGSRSLRLPVTKQPIQLRRFEVDPKLTWVDPKINPRDQEFLLRKDNQGVEELRAVLVREKQGNPALAREKEGPNGERWEIIDGSRRRAACLAEDARTADIYPLLIEVGVITDDADAMALARREESTALKFSPWERALSIERLKETAYKGLSLDEIAKQENVSLRSIKYYGSLASLRRDVVSLLSNPAALTLAQGQSLGTAIDALSKEDVDHMVKTQKTSFATASKLISQLTKLKPADKIDGKLHDQNCVGKWLDDQGNLLVEVKAVRDKPGEFTLRVHPHKDDIMAGIMQVVSQAGKKS
jgi:ParB/RepB/Spo0J family partition protein